MDKNKRPKKSPILVPVDFSNPSRAALELAAEFATALAAPLVVLHVVHDPGEAPGYYQLRGRKQQLRRMEEVAKDMFEDFMKHVIAESSYGDTLKRADTMVVVGLPVGRIMEVVEFVNARLVVMGSHGRTGLHRLMLGSKAQQAVNLCPVPITIVRPPE